MILSFLRRRKIDVSYSATLVSQLEAMISALSRDQPEDYWLAKLQQFRNRSAALRDSAQPEQWNQLAKDIQSIYGAMGSFNDNMYSQHLRDLQGALYRAAENTVRTTRRELGGTWVQIPDEQLFRQGQSVTLIRHEVISLQRDETPVRAPSSPLTYTVIGRIPNDIDNMPRYHIKSDSHVRYARHNALRAAGAP